MLLGASSQFFQQVSGAYSVGQRTELTSLNSGRRVQCGHLYVCACPPGVAIRTDVFETDFSTPIFEEYLGLGRKLSLILGSVLATVYALSACISFPLVDKAGRRKLFFIGTWGQALSMFLIMVRPSWILVLSIGTLVLTCHPPAGMPHRASPSGKLSRMPADLLTFLRTARQGL